MIDSKKIKADIDLQKYKHNELAIENIKGKITYSDNVISSNDLKFNVFGGSVSSKNCKLIFAQKENIGFAFKNCR